MRKIAKIACLFPVLGAAVAFSACASASNPDEEESSGVASAAITNVPAGVGCIGITVSGGRTVDRKFDVTVGQSSVLAMTGLPIGRVSFLGQAFAGACNAVTSASAATWASDPVPATLVAGVNTNVTLTLRRNGGATVGVDFADDPVNDPCVPESDAAFCGRLAKNCGAVSGMDNCGSPRTAASCGTCVAPLPNCGADNLCTGPIALATAPVLTSAGATADAYSNIAVYGDSVYWSEGAHVLKTPIAGGPSVALATQTDSGVWSLAAASVGVYWLEAFGSAPANIGTLNLVGFAGGGSSIVPTTGQLYAPVGVALNATHLYESAAMGTWNAGFINRVSLADGSITRLPGQDSVGVALDSTNVYYTTFARDAVTSSVMMMPLTATETSVPAVVAVGPNFARGIAVDSSSVYWVAYGGGGSVLRVGLGGGTPVPIATGFGGMTGYDMPAAAGARSFGGNQSATLVADDYYVYWTTPAGTVLKANKQSPSAVTTLASGQSQPTCIAVDGTNVYWINNGTGTLMKTAKGQ